MNVKPRSRAASATSETSSACSPCRLLHQDVQTGRDTGARCRDQFVMRNGDHRRVGIGAGSQGLHTGQDFGHAMRRFAGRFGVHVHAGAQRHARSRPDGRCQARGAVASTPDQSNTKLSSHG